MSSTGRLEGFACLGDSIVERMTIPREKMDLSEKEEEANSRAATLGPTPPQVLRPPPAARMIGWSQLVGKAQREMICLSHARHF